MAFADDVASKPVAEAMRQMSSIKRKLQDPSRVPGPRLSADKLDVCADHFAQVSRSDTWQGPADSERVTSTEDMGLTYHELLEAVKRMHNNKAPGPDGITAEILKLGGQALVSGHWRRLCIPCTELLEYGGWYHQIGVLSATTDMEGKGST